GCSAGLRRLARGRRWCCVLCLDGFLRFLCCLGACSFCRGARRFPWFRGRRSRGFASLAFVAPALLFFTDLRAEETCNDCAEDERSCEPNAKAHHCDGA